MKELLNKIFESFSGKIEGIVLVHKEEGTILNEVGETTTFREGIGVLGSAAETALKHINKNFKFLRVFLRNGSEIHIFPFQGHYLGISHREIPLQDLQNFIKAVKVEKVEVKEEKEPMKEEVPTEVTAREPQSPLESITSLKIKQINALIHEFAPDDDERWSKVVHAKIKDTSPKFADHINYKEKAFSVFYPLPENMNEDELNKSFKAAVDIIWKMAVSKFGVETTRKKVKNVAEKLKII